MKRFFLFSLFFSLSGIIYAQDSNAKKQNLVFYGEDFFAIEGATFNEKENLYDRLPLKSKDKVRTAVWNLSQNSAGISLRFFSNSSQIKIKWELLNDTRMNHMAETGIKGVDLYTRVNGEWKYVNTGRPNGKTSEALLVSTLTPENREFKVYLPLYDGVSRIEIGIDSLAKIEKPDSDNQLPIVFYGTSITQGGCASRPGMAYPSIISRKMDVDCINLGFSGNGKMEVAVLDAIAEINASFYVIDCLPNMTPEEVKDRVVPLANKLRSAQPNTPIVFVENIEYSKIYYEEATKKLIQAKNDALNAEFEKLKKSGMKNIFLISAKNAIGNDNEATVDGVHLTDLGFSRFADHLIKAFKKNNIRIISE